MPILLPKRNSRGLTAGAQPTATCPCPVAYRWTWRSPSRTIASARSRGFAGTTDQSFHLSRALGDRLAPKHWPSWMTFSAGADFLLGHNLISFDWPHLQAVSPNLRLLRLPGGGHASVESSGLSPQPLPSPGQATTRTVNSRGGAEATPTWTQDSPWRSSATSWNPSRRPQKTY